MPSTHESARTEIAHRALVGSFWITAASGITVTLGFARSVLLARLLRPEDFGVVGLAMAFIIFGHRLRSLGIPAAILHKQEVGGPYYESILTVHILTLAAALGIFLAVSPLLGPLYPDYPQLPQVAAGLFTVYTVAALTQVQEVVLQMRFRFAKLAAANVAAAATMTLIGPYLAWQGWGAWSLVGMEVAGIAVRSALLWGPWRAGPLKFRWDPGAVRWLFQFGRASWTSENVNTFLERFDDFWVGTALGSHALGFYNRAYEFVRYAVRAMLAPLIVVATPVFARLQHERAALAQAVLYVMSVSVRVGMLFTALVALLAPEFVHYVLTPKWAPLTLALQILSLYFTLAPIFDIHAYLLSVIGHPQVVARARIAQLFFFVPAVIAGAQLWGIYGVAFAVNGTVVIGLIPAVRATSRYARYPVLRVYLWPAIATLGGLAVVIGALGWAVLTTPQPLGGTALKGLLFLATYGAILWTTERRHLLQAARSLARVWRQSQGRSPV